MGWSPVNYLFTYNFRIKIHGAYGYYMESNIDHHFSHQICLIRNALKKAPA
jgi:hypothetical protein